MSRAKDRCYLTLSRDRKKYPIDFWRHLFGKNYCICKVLDRELLSNVYKIHTPKVIYERIDLRVPTNTPTCIYTYLCSTTICTHTYTWHYQCSYEHKHTCTMVYMCMCILYKYTIFPDATTEPSVCRAAVTLPYIFLVTDCATPSWAALFGPSPDLSFPARAQQ